MSIINIGRKLGLAVGKGAKVFWKDTKIEAKGVWSGTKKAPKKILKAAWEYPLTAGIVSGIGIGAVLPSGSKKSVSKEVREINRWAKQEGLTTPKQLKAAYRAAHKRRT